MTLVAVAPDTYSLGFDGSGRQIPDAYEVLDLCEALQRVYRTDAHVVAYVVDGAQRQPRINKPGLASFERPVTVSVFFCDVDNPNHTPWNKELLATALRFYNTLAPLQTTGIYLTKNGLRVVQPISRPIPAAEVEPYLRSWLQSLHDVGLDVDFNCKDWTRHFRLPNVRRDGVVRRTPFMALERMQMIDPPPPLEVDPARPQKRRKRSPRPPSGPWAQEVAPEWSACVAGIAEAIRGVESEWHALFLALAGALLDRGVPAQEMPALVGAISIATGVDSKTRDREAGARSTVERWSAGLPMTGLGELARNWPAVAAAVALPSSFVEAALPQSLEQARASLGDTIRHAPDGLTIIAAECGLGKTTAALEVAIERAARPYASPEAQGTRAPLGSKTALSVDKNDLAKQVARDIRRQGIPVRRLFGPLSCRDSKGDHVCQLAHIAIPLVAGGQHMQWELCQGRNIERCSFYDTCPARDGVEGDSDARITVGPHALLNALNGEAGTTGLLVIDEPPPLLESVTLHGEDLDAAERCLGWFEGLYASAMRPVLQAVRAWTLRFGELDVATSLEEAVRSCERVILPEDLERARKATGLDAHAHAVACAEAAPLDDRRGKAPPISFLYLRMAKQSAERAQTLGNASRVLKTLYYALTAKAPVAVRVEQRAEERVMIATWCNDQLVNAVRRQGAVVITDANAGLHVPVLQKIVGYSPSLHSYAAVDGAPIQRTLIRWPTATRKRWLKKGRLVICSGFLDALRALFDWANEDLAAQKLGIITFLPIESALRAVLEEPLKGQEDDLRLQLEPIFRTWKGSIAFGHYGAIRGLNSMGDVDCLATLGDPWQNLGKVKSEIAFLGLDQYWDQLLEEQTRAELEQAHGRLRAVHRQRPGRALHIGNLLPSGSGWHPSKVEVRERSRAKKPHERLPECDPVMKAVSEIGIVAAAKLAGVDRKTLSRYVTGKRSMPESVRHAILGTATTKGLALLK